MISDTDTQTLDFVEPLPGFDAERSYTLSALDDAGVLLSMRSVREPGLRFVLASPDTFFDDYRPAVGTDVRGALGSVDGADLRVLVMLTIGRGLADATANLRAPIVLSTATRRAIQAVLDDDSLPMRRPVVSRTYP